jgi:hypothetical protein
MSFDPQPIRLKGYTSTYVDPKYDVMLESLNKRYETNYAANDALEAQLLQLESAPFDSDRSERIKVIKDTQKKLQEYADRGDFENLSISLARTGKEYAKAAAPITANAKAYSAYKSSLDEMVKNNDIDAGTKNKLLGYSAANYKGFSRDETGMVDPNSMFMGVGAVKDPKVLDMLDTHLAKIVADGDKSRIKRVDQVQYDANGNPLPGRYEVLTESGWERVSEQDVLNSFGVVMNEPKVTSYLNQQAVLNTYDMTPDKLNSWAQGTFDSYSKIKQSLEEKKTKLESEAGNILQKDPTTLNATQQQAVAAYNNINSQLSEVDRRMSQFKGAAGNEEALRNMAMKGWYEDKYKEYQQYATNTFAYDKVTANTSEITWDSAYLKEVENAAKNGTTVGAEVITEMPATETPLASQSFESISTATTTAEQNIVKIDKQLNDPNNPLSESLRANLESQKRNLQSNIEFNNELIRRTTNKSISINDLQSVIPKEALNVLQTMYPNKKTNEFINEVINTLQNTSNPAYINFKNSFIREYGEDKFNAINATIYNYDRAKIVIGGSTATGFGTPSNIELNEKAISDGATALRKNINNLVTTKINENLTSNPKIAVTMTNMFPGLTDQERKANTKAIRERFEKGIDTGLPVWIEGQDPNTASNINDLIEKGIIPIDYVVDVNKIAINTESGSTGNSFGEDIIVLPIKKKESEEYVNIFVPANSVYTPSMQQALNAPSNRFSRIMTKASILPELQGEENYYNHNIISTAADPELQGPWTFQINPSNNTVRVIHNGDKTEWYSPQDPEFKRLYLNKKGIGDKF